MIITDNPAVNKISFERGPRSERGPGCARAARQNGLLNEAFLARPARGAQLGTPFTPRTPFKGNFVSRTSNWQCFFTIWAQGCSREHQSVRSIFKMALDPENWPVTKEFPQSWGAALAADQLLKGLDASLLLSVDGANISLPTRHRALHKVQSRDCLSFPTLRIHYLLSHDWKTSPSRRFWPCWSISTPWQNIESATDNSTRTTVPISQLPLLTLGVFPLLLAESPQLGKPKIVFLDKLRVAIQTWKLIP